VDRDLIVQKNAVASARLATRSAFSTYLFWAGMDSDILGNLEVWDFEHRDFDHDFRASPLNG
jgi:hypothetical protein